MTSTRSGTPAPGEQGAQAVPQGEGQLRPARPGPDHPDPQPPASFETAPLRLRPPFPEEVDRLDPEGVFFRPRDGVQGRARADVQGQEVEPDRRAAGHQDPSGAKVDLRRRAVHDPRIREPAELSQVDVRLLRSVVARDQAGQHAGVGGQQVTRYQGEPHPGDRPHPEALEHRHVAVPAPDQHDVGGHGRRGAGGCVRAMPHEA